MSVESFTPDTAYMTKSNIVHPLGSRPTIVAAAEAASRAELTNRRGLAVTGGAVRV